MFTLAVTPITDPSISLWIEGARLLIQTGVLGTLLAGLIYFTRNDLKQMTKETNDALKDMTESVNDLILSFAWLPEQFKERAEERNRKIRDRK